jgi:hypothetical protein
MVKKRTVQTLLLVFSALLLLVSVTVSASAQGYFVEGEIRWVNRFGVVPAGPGNSSAAAAPCSIFSVVALDAKSKKPVAYTDQVASPFRFTFFQSVNYVCRYSLQVPEDRDLYIMATMGNVQMLPKADRDPYLITGPWIADGGRTPQPPAGYERAFTGSRYVNLRSRVTSKKVAWIVDFQMTYVNSEASEKGTPPFFTGAWRGKLGEGMFELILQQRGSQVTGRVNVNSAIYDIKDGMLVGNTLRFTIVRPDRALPGGLNLPGEVVGSGELVMDAGGTSFNGYLLGTAVTGASIGS